MRSPSFTLSDHNGQAVSSKDYSGRSLIIFFYPAAMTPGCTTEACDFRDNYDALLAAGYEVVGISPDEPERNAAFREKEGLPFPLLSDPAHKIAEAFGAWGIKKNYGREYEGLIRSTFVVGVDGELEREYRNVKATGHVARVTKDLLGE
ncbi:MAG: thioredoxin-dependent thiol peroxidase [Acidimicrobiia bacterium]|nr:thioredoxin-dependent thiol peroxidase [Acidimicrobiia bacterium]MDH4307553.1 thioredoxin-dependent thiol peroxidase [Acidimicrobiia bacterium]